MVVVVTVLSIWDEFDHNSSSKKKFIIAIQYIWEMEEIYLFPPMPPVDD